MKRLVAAGLAILAFTAPAAESWVCGLPIDVVALEHNDRQNLEVLFQNASGKDGAPLSTFWATWNQSALQRAVRPLTGVQKISFDTVAPQTPFRFSALHDSNQAITQVENGTLPFAWVRGDILQDRGAVKVRKVAYGRAYFDSPAQENFVLVARTDRKYPALGTLDAAGMQRAADFIKRNGLHFGYGNAPDEALRPFQTAAISPFALDSSLAPYLFVPKYLSDLDGVSLLIAGSEGKNGIDLAVIDPRQWKYYASEYPGSAKVVTPVWTEKTFLVLARVGELPNNHFAPNDAASLEFLKRARLEIFTDEGRPAFTTQLSTTDIGQRALAHEVQPPKEKALDYDDSALDALVSGFGIDVLLVRQRSLDVYRNNKPGAGRMAQVIATLPPVANPVLIANPQLVPPATIATLQSELSDYNWRTAKTFGGSLVLLRGFSHYSLPEGDQP